MRVFALLIFFVSCLSVKAQDSSEPTSVRSRSSANGKVVDRLFGVKVKPSPLTPPMADKIEKQMNGHSEEKHGGRFEPVDPVELPIVPETKASLGPDPDEVSANKRFVDHTPEPELMKEDSVSQPSKARASSSSVRVSENMSSPSSVSTKQGGKPFAGLFGKKSNEERKPGLLQKIFGKKDRSPEPVSVTK